MGQPREPGKTFLLVVSQLTLKCRRPFRLELGRVADATDSFGPVLVRDAAESEAAYRCAEIELLPDTFDAMPSQMFSQT